MKKSSFNLVRPYAPQKQPMAPGFEDLPLNLLRTSLITRQPEVSGEAAARFIAQMQGHEDPPVYLPQSMQFGHWNRQNDGVNQGDLPPGTSTAVGFMAAMRQSGTARIPRVVGSAPHRPMYQAAAELGGAEIPGIDTQVGPAPISRRFPDPPPAIAPPPSAFVDAVTHIQELRRNERAASRTRASQEALESASARSAIFGRWR